MVTVTLKFNEEKLKKIGRTADEMLEPIRKLMEQNDVEEVSAGYFRKDGCYDMDALILPLKYIRKHMDYLKYLDEWMLDVDGDIEDCKAEMISYARRHPEMLK